LENQPIRFYYTLPAFCGLTPAQETQAPDNAAYLPYLQTAECLGVGKYTGVIYSSMEFRDAGFVSWSAWRCGWESVLKAYRRTPSQGLQAYAGFGFSSCHEPITYAEAWNG
jgi:adenine deaminase